MRAITIQQPYAWAIATGHKLVENRRDRRGPQTARRVFDHPGPVLIHAGGRYAGQDAYREVQHLTRGAMPEPGSPNADTAAAFGAVIAVATLTGVHVSSECADQATGDLCSPWAWPGAAHLELAAPRLLHRPVFVAGQLGLWNLTDTDLLAQIRRQAS